MPDAPPHRIQAAAPPRLRRRADIARRHEFQDLAKLDIVGIFPNYAVRLRGLEGKAQATVDNAQMRYFIVHLHRLLDPQA